MMASVEERLREHGIHLPSVPPRPIGAFANVVIHAGLAWVSGQGPVHPDGRLEMGKVGRDVSPEVARTHARMVGLNMLAALHGALGDLNRIERVVKLQGLVNAVDTFRQHPFVIDGASELMLQVFGEIGVHGRTSFGVSSLPNNITVEIDGVFALRPAQ